MDGYTLTSKMRQARRTFRFTATEQALFYELMAVCNSEDWQDVFRCSNMELCFALSINKNTLIKARNILINSGIIEYKSGKSKRDIGEYSFITGTLSGLKYKPDSIPNPIPNPIPNSRHYLKQETKKKTEENFTKEKSEIEIAFENFNEYLDNHCPNIRKLKKQMALDEYEKLKSRFSPEVLTEKLNAMENKADLNKKYTSVYLTLNNWAKNG